MKSIIPIFSFAFSVVALAEESTAEKERMLREQISETLRGISVKPPHPPAVSHSNSTAEIMSLISQHLATHEGRAASVGIYRNVVKTDISNKDLMNWLRESKADIASSSNALLILEESLYGECSSYIVLKRKMRVPMSGRSFLFPSMASPYILCLAPMSDQLSTAELDWDSIVYILDKDSEAAPGKWMINRIGLEQLKLQLKSEKAAK